MDYCIEIYYVWKEIVLTNRDFFFSKWYEKLPHYFVFVEIDTISLFSWFQEARIYKYLFFIWKFEVSVDLKHRLLVFTLFSNDLSPFLHVVILHFFLSIDVLNMLFLVKLARILYLVSYLALLLKQIKWRLLGLIYHFAELSYCYHR